MSRHEGWRTLLIALALALLMGGGGLYNLTAVLPTDGAAHAQQETRTLMVYYSLLPRLAVTVLAGGALGLAGALLQRLLRNPLAEPSTLGVSAGAYLALAIVTLFAPGLAARAPEAVTFAGAVVALVDDRAAGAVLVVVEAEIGIVADLAVRLQQKCRCIEIEVLPVGSADVPAQADHDFIQAR